jgi:sterol desaturase/sphingolipid hydroxylase (fatty acid hydroxylase superfamily)
VLGVVFLIARQFEKRSPIETEQSAAEVIVDWKLASLRFGSGQLLSPIKNACAIMLVNAAGGGWITLRSDGWWFLLSFIILILAIDLWAYLAHRAQHKFAVLWAMHSLHHSAEALSMVTGARHFWLEDPLISAVFPVVGIVFKVPPEMVTPITLLYFLAGDGMAHLNLRVPLGRFALIFNNPQYHRIHHSVERQHQNKNFCKMLPLFDLIFGTAWKPGKDEFPMTGLVPREQATGFLDGIIWPVRHRLSWVGSPGDRERASARSERRWAISRRLLSDERGAALALTAISLAVLLGFAGLGVETGLWYTIKRHDQNAADFAALSGAMELAAGQSYSDICAVASRDAQRNGFPLAAGWSCPAQSPTQQSQCTNLASGQMCVNWPPLFPSYSGDPLVGDKAAVEVILAQQQNTFFAGLAFCNNCTPLRSVTIDTRAVATTRLLNGGNAIACALALTTTGTGLDVSGGGNVTMPNCGLASDSTGAKSINIQGSSTSLTASYIDAAGGENTNGNPTINVQTVLTYTAPVADPFTCSPPKLGCIGSITWPSVSGKEDTSSRTGGTTCTNPQVLTPGTYSGPMNFTSGCTLLCPGVYVVDGEDNSSDGAFEASGNSTTVQMGTAGTTYTNNAGKNITCPTTTMANGNPMDGVTIIASSKGSTTQGGGFDFTAGATVTLSAPNSSPATGIPAAVLFAQDPSHADTKPNGNGKEADSTIQSGTNVTFTGIMYTPKTNATLQANTHSSCFIIIALTVTLNGGAQMAADSTHCQGAGISTNGDPQVLTVGLAG